VLECWDRRDKISAISCLTVSPKVARPGLYFELLPDDANVHAEDVVAFLEQLRRRLGGPLTVIWDRSNLHSKSRLVRAWLLDKPDVVVEDFPGYVPELNPDEGVWGWTKYGRLANLAAASTDWLRDFVWEELDQAKHSPSLLRAFLKQTGLPGLVPLSL
jgi:transposase